VTGPVVLVVLDGFGIGDGGPSDATALAHSPFLHRLATTRPNAEIETSGDADGLPAGQMGNSEVGHMTMGAGRVILQDMTRISKAFAEGAMETNPGIQAALASVEQTGGTLHLMGLLSDGGVHSHQEHLYAILEGCRRRGIPTAVHAFLDGRDTPPRSALSYMRKLMPHIERCGSQVATVCGRYYAMDRDNRWDRVQRAYEAIVCRRGLTEADAIQAVEDAYARGENDEFVQPSVIDGGRALADGDGVLFFNFRADRARELTNAITGADPARFADQLVRERVVAPSVFLCLTRYDAGYGLPIAFEPQSHEKVLGEVIAAAGLDQLRMAETEKYAHVTFFFNAGVEKPFPGEDRLLIPSPRDVDTYDHRPEMSAQRLCEALVEKIAEHDYAFVLVNFANPDMVGHTGVLDAAVKAVETIDSCLERLSTAVLEQGGQMLITADHGNCELMVDPETGEPHTAHTTNPVPIYWVTPEPTSHRLHNGSLADLAPTVLALMQLPVPKEMSGRSLID
jgi:2,3-bisphosphoglycerate-independent phosphoglycerate mutase